MVGGLVEETVEPAVATIDASSGKIILMSAPGFLPQSERPFHFVEDIQSTRHVFGLRQKILHHDQKNTLNW